MRAQFIHAQRPEEDIVCPPLSSCLISLKQGLSWNSELEIFHLGGPQAPSLLLSLRPSSSIRTTSSFGHAWLFTQMLVIWAQVLVPVQQKLIQTEPSPRPHIFDNFYKFNLWSLPIYTPTGRFLRISNKWFFSLYISSVSEGCLCNCRESAHGNVSRQLKLARELDHISPEVVWSCYLYLWKLIK